MRSALTVVAWLALAGVLVVCVAAEPVIAWCLLGGAVLRRLRRQPRRLGDAA